MRLSPAAQRVLGSLAEKRLTTPNQYPLTVAALRTACNQRSAREPVMDLSENDVHQALRELRDEGLARTSPVRGRVPKHEHTLDVQLDLTPPDCTVLGVLLLRGPQTVGEIRTRTERWVAFADLDAVQTVLERLATHRLLPLVVELEREPGRRETRWAHLLGEDPTAAPEPPAVRTAPSPAAAPPGPPATTAPPGPAVVTAPATTAAPAASPSPELAARVDELEATVRRLAGELAELRARVTPVLEELT